MRLGKDEGMANEVGDGVHGIGSKGSDCAWA